VPDGPLQVVYRRTVHEKLYMRYFEEIEKSKGKKFEDRFVAWLSGELYSKNCLARIKIAQEMRI
jgi:hypothetical protein